MIYRAVLICLSLVACASGPDWKSVSAQAGDRQRQCKVENADEVAAARCGINATHDIFAANGYPYMDLVDQYGANLLVAVERHAGGKLTDAELAAVKADLNAQFVTAVDQRDNDAKMTDAAQRSAMRLPTVCGPLGYATVCN